MKSNKICKETGKCDPYSGGKKQAIEIAFEEVQMVDLADKDFK